MLRKVEITDNDLLNSVAVDDKEIKICCRNYDKIMNVLKKMENCMSLTVLIMLSTIFVTIFGSPQQARA